MDRDAAYLVRTHLGASMRHKRRWLLQRSGWCALAAVAEAICGASPAGAAGHIRLSLRERAVSLSAPPAELSAMVTDANDDQRVGGVPDGLNSGIVDPDKVRRFVAALPAQPAALLGRLAGNQLQLDWAGLGLGLATPTRAALFSEPFTLTIEDIFYGNVIAHTDVPLDPALAKANSLAAEAAFAEVQDAVRMAEQTNQSAALSDAKLRRSTLALAWRPNAEAWAKASLTDPAAQRSKTAADFAVDHYNMPRGVYQPRKR